MQAIPLRYIGYAVPSERSIEIWPVSGNAAHAGKAGAGCRTPKWLCANSADPNPGGGGLAEVHGSAAGAQGHRFVVFALFDFDLGFGAQFQISRKARNCASFS